MFSAKVTSVFAFPGIMVSGELRCLGASQYLKNRYGNGYRISVKIALEAEEAAHTYVHRVLCVSIVCTCV